MTNKKKIDKKKKSGEDLFILDIKDRKRIADAEYEMRRRTDIDRITVPEFTRVCGGSYERDIRHLKHLVGIQAFARSAAKEHYSRATQNRVRRTLKILSEVFQIDNS